MDRAKYFSSYNPKYIGRYADRNVEFFICCLNIGDNLWLILFMALLGESPAPYFTKAICFAFPFFVWGVRCELFAVLSFHFLFLFSLLRLSGDENIGNFNLLFCFRNFLRNDKHRQMSHLKEVE